MDAHWKRRNACDVRVSPSGLWTLAGSGKTLSYYTFILKGYLNTYKVLYMGSQFQGLSLLGCGIYHTTNSSYFLFVLT